MSRGGRHGYSVRVEKSYWLFDTESNYETDSNRKRKGNEKVKRKGGKAAMEPAEKKRKTENAGSGDKNETAPHVSANQSSIVPFDQRSSIKCCECNNEMDDRNYVENELFDDMESVGTEYDEGQAFFTELFNGIDNVSSEITNASDDGTNFFPDILNIFADVPSEDDEDRVIITEIFDDTETTAPEKGGKCVK